MVGKCSLCLEVLTEPVSVPCGHVYCAQCLQGYINMYDGALFLSCPTCRGPFNTVSPNPACIPHRYHAFLFPAVRKLYVDDSLHAELNSQLKKLKKQVEALEEEKENLTGVSQHHRARAIQNRMQVKRLEKELEREKEGSQNLLNMNCALEAGSQALKKQYNELSRAFRDIRRQSDRILQTSTTPSGSKVDDSLTQATDGGPSTRLRSRSQGAKRALSDSASSFQISKRSRMQDP